MLASNLHMHNYGFRSADVMDVFGRQSGGAQAMLQAKQDGQRRSCSKFALRSRESFRASHLKVLTVSVFFLERGLAF